MAEPARAWRLIGALGVVLAFSSTTVAASELTGPQERGKEIYFSGSSPSGDPIRAFFGEDGLELPGEVATCGSCHGHDGKGRPESGVVPSNITWQHLTRSYGHLHADGLEHPPFDEQSLRAYMRTGVYPGGRKGDPSMPLYEISDRDLEDLLAYMRLVGELLEPGLSPTAIRIATLLPAEGTLGEIGRVIRDVLEAYFRDVNEAGGIYGRRLELVVHEIPEAQASVPEAALAWLGESQPFALVSPFTPRMDEQVHSAASEKGIPLIGPFSLYSVRSFVHNRNVFYLYSGLAEQLEALLQFADAELGLSEPRVAVLYPDENALSDVLDAVQTSGEKRGWPALRREPYSVAAFDAASSVEALRLARIDVVVCLGVAHELRSFLAAAEQREWRPFVLAAGAVSGDALFAAPPEFATRLHLAYPTLPHDREPWALGDVSRLLAGSDLAGSHPQTVVSAYSAAALLAEGLRRAGRELGRRELIAELEKLYQFETGLTPPLTYSANRRIGARGAYILAPEALKEGRLPEAVEWMDLP